MPRKESSTATADPVVGGKAVSAYTTEELLALQKFGPALLGDPADPATGHALAARAQMVARQTKQGRFGPALLADPATMTPTPKPAA